MAVAERAPASKAPEDRGAGLTLAPAPPPASVPEGRRSRPPARLFRFFRAYWVTFVVIASYLSVRLQARFRSAESIERILRKKHLRNARRIERAIVLLQGLFIKVGQLISIMTNFLPDEFRAELRGLQDQVPPRPYADIERRIHEELSASPDELFATFERTPIASASIGQVHLATLKDGTRVAVKVQYPDIDRLVATDLKTLHRILRIVSWFVRYQGLDDLYREVRAMILAELDFGAEADNATRIADNFTGREEAAFPRVVPSLSTARVLTTRFEDGVKVGDLARLDAGGIDRAKLARLVVELYCKQIFTDGVYHADPHPGNLLARRLPDGKLCVVFLDFGAVAEVSPAMREGIVELIQGAIARDTPRIVAAIKQMGFIARGADDHVFDRVVEFFYERFQEQISLDSLNLKDIRFDPEKSLGDLADLRRMDISLAELSASFHVPKEWILLERTLLLLMGLCTALDPGLNPMTVIRPYLERFVLGEEGDWSTFVLTTARDAVMSVATLPSDLRKLVASARAGELSFRVKHAERHTRAMVRTGHQIILAAVGIAAAAFALILEGRSELARADIAWWVVKGAGAWLAWSWWTTRSLLRRR